MNNIMNEKEKEFYNKIGSIIGWDFSKLKYSLVDESAFQYFDEINKNVTSNTILLDIGTGGGEKLINLISNECLLKIGTDFSEEMIKIANQNNINDKIKFFEMDSENIYFPNNFFDIICARHTPFKIEEIYRLLKNDGLFFSEQIDEDDCKSLKKIFNRGQGYNVNVKLIDKLKAEIKKQTFKNVEFFNIEQKEYYETEQDLLFLLKNTPIIPNFGSDENDYKNFQEYIEENKTERGILLERKLFGIRVLK